MRSALFFLSVAQAQLGLNIPFAANLAQMVDTAALKLTNLVSNTQQHALNTVNPLEDMRASAITVRDKLLIDRLDNMDSLYQPVRGFATFLGRPLQRVTGGLDNVASSILLNPLNRTSNVVGGLEQRFLDFARTAFAPTAIENEI